jgi:hypothetical protein
MNIPKESILFIGIGFYDYDLSIKHQLEDIGFEVDYYCETTYDVRYRYYSRIKNIARVKEIDDQNCLRIAKESGRDYNFVFVIKGALLTIDSLELIKLKNPDAIFILYLWDSIVRMPNFQNIRTYFHKIYSFDRLDCISDPSLIFLPLFFRKEYKELSEVPSRHTFDIYFLGWYHSDRFEIAKSIIDFCRLNKLTYSINIYTGLFSYIIKVLTDKKARKYSEAYIFSEMSNRKNFDNLLNSSCVLDIAHPFQSGLTIRTIEMLGAHKKIITTNSDIVNYDFFNPKNIMILNRDCSNLDIDFFKLPYETIDESIIRKYSIENWAETIFDKDS